MQTRRLGEQSEGDGRAGDHRDEHQHVRAGRAGGVAETRSPAEGQSTVQPGFGLSSVSARFACAANVATSPTGMVPSFRPT